MVNDKDIDDIGGFQTRSGKVEVTLSLGEKKPKEKESKEKESKEK